MPGDKRPKPTIDATAGRVSESDSRPLLPGAGSGSAGERKLAAGGPAPAKAQDRGQGFIGYALAGILGGAVAASGMYFASQAGFAGFSLAGSEARKHVAELEDRTASLESAVRAFARQSPGSAHQPASAAPENVNELRARLDGIVGAARGLDQTVQALSLKVEDLEQHPGGGESKEAIRAEIAAQTAPLQQRLTSAERELEMLTRAQNERQADARTASLTLALTNLKRAVAEGRPFATELAAVETMSPTRLPVSLLAQYKDRGVSAMAELQSDFVDASAKTVEAYYANKSNSLMGEMLSRAKSVVQVKPADSSGGSVEAILGRMNTALKAGDLKTALLQGATLPHPPQQMMDWFAKAQARVAADEAIRKTDQELLASLTKPPAHK